jgi:hypothetical protein
VLFSRILAFVRTKPGRSASIAVFAILTIVALVTYRSYGISNDEEVQQTYGELLLRFYASGFTDDNAFHYRNLYLYGGLFDLVAAGIGQHLAMPTYEWRHLLSAIVGLIGMWGTWRLTRLLSSDAWGCFAVVLLAATGSWWGPLFNETKDISFAAAMIWVTYYSARIAPQLPNPRLRHVIGLGAALGCALGLRIVAVYAGLELAVLVIVAAIAANEGPLAILKRLGLSVLRLLPAGGVALAIMAVAWPWSVFAPLNVLVAIDTFSRFPINMLTRLDGVVMKAANVPRWYLPIYLLVRLPELTQVGIVIGAAAGAIRSARRSVEGLHALRLLPVILAVAVPLGHAILTKPVLYNGIRHYMFLLPPITVLATVGLRAAYLLITDRAGKRAGYAFAGVCGAAWLYHAIVLVILHPYETVAYNAFAGGVSGAVDKYEFDYHGNSIREAAIRLSQVVAEEEENGHRDPRFGPPYRVAVCAELLQADEYLSSTFRVTTNWLNADFFISPIQDGCENVLVGNPIIKIERMGATIGVVKDRRYLTRGAVQTP